MPDTCFPGLPAAGKRACDLILPSGTAAESGEGFEERPSLLRREGISSFIPLGTFVWGMQCLELWQPFWDNGRRGRRPERGRVEGLKAPWGQMTPSCCASSEFPSARVCM